MPRSAGGFTLLEVLVAMAIVGLGVATILQLTSQNLRLLRLAGEHQHAIALADQIVRRTEPDSESVDSGQEGLFAWERRVARVPLPDELTAAGEQRAELWSVSVAVRWSGNRSVQIATLRASLSDPLEAVNQPSQGANQPSQGMNQPSQGMNQPSQGMNRPSQGVNRPPQGVNRSPQGMSR
jgi:prepilin-type N-terminal cleavage/methylation domain-containing protein